MAQRQRLAPPKRLEKLRERIEHWRSTRVKLWPMPGELWKEATALAHELGICPVQRALKVNYESLRQRVDEAPRPRDGAGGAGDGFVELSGAQLLGLPVATSGPVVELSDGNGVRLTVRLAAGSALDVTRLVEAFRGRPA